MLFQKSRSEKVQDKADELSSAAGDVFTSVREKVAPAVEDVFHQAEGAFHQAKEQAGPAAKKVKKNAGPAKEKVAAFAAPAAEKVRDNASPVIDKVADATEPARERVAEAAGFTRDQVHHLFADEWMPRIEKAVAAATAGTTAAVSKLPDSAQDQVAKVAPQVVKSKKKGRVLIVLGVLALAGAGVLYYQGQQKKKASDPWQSATATPIPVTEDLAGDVNKSADAELAGRHSAEA